MTAVHNVGLLLWGCCGGMLVVARLYTLGQITRVVDVFCCGFSCTPVFHQSQGF